MIVFIFISGYSLAIIKLIVATSMKRLYIKKRSFADAESYMNIRKNINTYHDVGWIGFYRYCRSTGYPFLYTCHRSHCVVYR